MERNVLVDKLKGYACFLVLFGHVIMGIRLAGIDIPKFFEGVEKFIWSFHIALFMFLSGVVYKETGGWKRKKTRIKFIWYKLLSLGIPYVVFSVVYIAINSMVGQANTQSSMWDILDIWKTPVAQYWFLYALFFLFLIWALFSGLLNSWILTLVVVAIGYVAPLCGINLGSFDVVFYTALSFGIGTCVDFPKLLKPPTLVKYIVVVTHLVTGIVLVVVGKIEEPFIKEMMALYGIYASIMLISLLQKSKTMSRFLGFVNRYSFQTYLLHTIFTAGVRIVFMRMNITWWWLHILLGTVCGIAFSVLAAEIAKKIPFFNFFFFPTKASKYQFRIVKDHKKDK